MNNSRLTGLSFIALLGILVALFLAARDGDVLSIVILSVLAAILLIFIGVGIVLVALAIWQRMHGAQMAAICDLADAQSSTARAMATWGRASQYQTPYNPAAFPALPDAQPVQQGAGLLLPQITTYRAVAQDEVENDDTL